jgi:hypothetical protein
VALERRPSGRRDHGPANERHYPVDGDTAVRIAGVLAGYADGGTGRSARPTIDALMAETGSCERTVQYALQLLEALHLVVRVVEGRSIMTRRERLRAWRNGSSARQIAAEFACVMPAALLATVHSRARQVVDGCTPPGYTEGESGSLRESEVLRGRKDRRMSLAGARHPPRRARPALTPATARRYRLAAGLQQLVPWLSGVSPRRLTSLHRFAAQRWTPRDVVRSIDELMRVRGWRYPEQIANPPAYLAMLLRGIEPTDLEQRGAEDAARAEWRRITTFGPECPHGHAGGDVPHPIDGYKPCPFCRREEHHQ